MTNSNRMSDIEKLTQIVETNFRLNQISHQETAAQMRVVSKTLETLSGSMERLAVKQEVMAARLESSIQAMRGLASNTEIRQEIVDIKARLDRLEEQAS